MRTLPAFCAVMSLFLLSVLLGRSTSDQCPSSCGSLANVSFPWGAATGCGSGPGFVLSDCETNSNSSPEWIFQVPGAQPLEYTVQDIFYNDSTGFAGLVTLTTLSNKTSEKTELCASLDMSLFSTYFPMLNNTYFPWSATFEVSDHMVYLLLGCANKMFHSPYCAAFLQQCSIPLNCFQYIQAPNQTVTQVVADWNCSSFVSFWTPRSYEDMEAVNSSEWDRNIVQLYWLEPEFLDDCIACTAVGGICKYQQSAKNIINFQCGKSMTGCSGRICSKAMQGVVYGVVPVIAAGIVMFVMTFIMRQRKKYMSKSAVGSNVSSNYKFWTERALGLSRKYGPVPVKEFSYMELLVATDSFDDNRMIGDGGFGAVYLAHLKDGRKAAVKRLYHDNFKRMDQFYNEIQILSSLRHPNLVKLYGFCCEDDRDLLLVFEYASQGTVADHLHDLSKQDLPWKVRINVAVETAEALSYLHKSVSPPIYHRDVKTTNMLLDENFHAKLADFGLSRLVPMEASHVSTAPQGTPGYLDPDYYQCYQLTDKSDVYSFGVVLIELVSGKLAVDLSRNRREINLANLALIKITGGMWEELVDPRLCIDEDANVKQMVKGVIELAFSCLHAEKDDRPTMSHVTDVLTKLRDDGYPREPSAPLCKAELDETTHLIRSQSSVCSPTSVHSIWPSSNTSAELSILY